MVPPHEKLVSATISSKLLSTFVESGVTSFVQLHATPPRGPPRRASAYKISKSTGFHVDFGFQNGFLDFKVDFWISKWISGFQSGFLDFKRISGFQSGFLDFAISEDTAKIYS